MPADDDTLDVARHAFIRTRTPIYPPQQVEACGGFHVIDFWRVALRTEDLIEYTPKLQAYRMQDLATAEIYLSCINRKKRLVTRQPVMIQNPHARLKSDPRFQIQPSTMLVEGNICGNLIAGKTTAKNKPR